MHSERNKPKQQGGYQPTRRALENAERDAMSPNEQSTVSPTRAGGQQQQQATAIGSIVHASAASAHLLQFDGTLSSHGPPGTSGSSSPWPQGTCVGADSDGGTDGGRTTQRYPGSHRNPPLLPPPLTRMPSSRRGSDSAPLATPVAMSVARRRACCTFLQLILQYEESSPYESYEVLPTGPRNVIQSDGIACMHACMHAVVYPSSPSCQVLSY
jgi:hypothetical protein